MVKKLPFSVVQGDHLPVPEKGLINPFIEERFDMCPICKQQKVDLFSFNGYPQHYKEAVDGYLAGYDAKFDNWEIRSMRCKSCGKEFTIDWSSGFPRPLRDTRRTNVFFAEFMMGI